MISEKMLELGRKRSEIREIFEYGKKRGSEIGADKVFDFSIGNPNVPAPEFIRDNIIDLLMNEDPTKIHGYTSAQGDISVRKALADHINSKYGTDITADNFYLTAGAAASLSMCCRALALPGDEFLAFAPYFPEYKVYVESAGAVLSVIPANTDNFQADLEKFEKAVNKNTKAVIINSPNNPSGVVYSLETIKEICSVMERKSKEFGHVIYLISDEPYRELVYGDVEVSFLLNHYDNTFVCYSYSKSLSLPGERIGYVLVSNKMKDGEDVYAAVCGAGRALGYVCAPSLFQHLIARCLGRTADISIYKRNRDILYSGLASMGYECAKPDGAFYLFVKALEPDAVAFCEKAKKYELLLVPGDGFGCPGYARISYCVRTDQIEDSLPAFEKLAAEYKK
ncbi:MAG: pyridoxal phosphate-dependent aminotransferase [Synergistaceae bacterium]|jgi:aspartate aminotransferase|nr:pyridoxal phosphate-dependent aminotransferase [Synergistaceae bacterium]MBP9559304.1 pyridoxal phosphate-dependent aminotransferase [Synergistaceae bacterium]MBP9974867.1 pyridoxal phosphate-dependent aminotransferase [Synergistaceae bacterium]MCE5184486.1 pyridoxal phosphate-dependent aminotransferase [Synergistaceae bacterium]